jgi:hypothetical protein
VTNLLEILGEGLQEGEQHVPGALPGVADRRAKLPVVPGQEILPAAVTAPQAALLREPHHLDEHLAQTERVSETRRPARSRWAALLARRPPTSLSAPASRLAIGRLRGDQKQRGGGGGSNREWLWSASAAPRRRWWSSSGGGRLGVTAGEKPFFCSQESSQAD